MNVINNTMLCRHLSLYKVLVIFIFIFSTNVFGQDFEEIFKPDFQKAINIFYDIKPRMEEQINSLDGDYFLCASMVFPEIIRYSLLKDQMETIALEVFYTKFGNEYANFSIGLFQMKPSFVERLEKEIIGFPKLSEFHFISEYPVYISKEKERDLRLNRLRDIDWQTTYLVCFVKLLEIIHQNKYNDLNLTVVKNKIAFFSTSYNTGFWYDVDEILKYQKFDQFPFGNRVVDGQCNYGDLSYYFYQNYISKFTE